jgi:hypothetical protein
MKVQKLMDKFLMLHTCHALTFICYKPIFSYICPMYTWKPGTELTDQPKGHINQLAVKLSSAAYAIRTLSFVMSQASLLMTYYAYVHSIMSYGIIFWGNATHSKLIFKIQKRIVRTIMKARNKDSCHPLFRLLNILPFYSQYIFSISIFAVKNTNIFILNLDIHSIHTRQGLDLHHSTSKLTKVQKGVSYSGIRIFNNLPQNIKNCQVMLTSLNMP